MANIKKHNGKPMGGISDHSKLKASSLALSGAGHTFLQSGTGAVAQDLDDVVKNLPTIDPTSFGVVADAQIGEGGAIDTGVSTTTLTVTSQYFFVSGDAGKTIVIQGAGSAGATLVTTIASFTSDHVVEITDAASTTVTNARFAWGTDDTTAWQAAIDSRQDNALPGVIQLPNDAEGSIISDTLLISSSGIVISGTNHTGIGHNRSSGVGWDTTPTTDGVVEWWGRSWFAWAGASNGTMLEIRPLVKADFNDTLRLTGSSVQHIRFYGMLHADTAIEVTTLAHAVFKDITIDFTLGFGIVLQYLERTVEIADNASISDCRFERIWFNQLTGSNTGGGINMLRRANYAGNTHNCVFEQITGTRDSTGLPLIRSNDSDHNVYIKVRSFPATEVGVELQGNAWNNGAREELFHAVTGALMVHGTESYTYPAYSNIFYQIDTGNGTPIPVNPTHIGTGTNTIAITDRHQITDGLNSMNWTDVLSAIQGSAEVAADTFTGGNFVGDKLGLGGASTYRIHSMESATDTSGAPTHALLSYTMNQSGPGTGQFSAFGAEIIKTDSYANTTNPSMIGNKTFIHLTTGGSGSGAHTVDEVAGQQSRVDVDNPDCTLTVANCFRAFMTPVTDATVSNSVGYNLKSPSVSGTGTITNAFGYYCPSITAASSNWAFYSAGATTPSYLAGKLGVGGTAGSENIQLNADGTASLSGVLTSTVSTGTAPFTVSSTTEVANLRAATATTADQVTTTQESGSSSYHQIPFLLESSGDLYREQITTPFPLSYRPSDQTLVVPNLRLGSVDVTANGTEINYLAGVTGTTGTGNLVLSDSATLTGNITHTDSYDTAGGSYLGALSSIITLTPSSSTSNTVYGATFATNLGNTAYNMGKIRAVDFDIALSGTGTTTEAISSHHRLYTALSGTQVTSAYGSKSLVMAFTSGSTITTGYGYHARCQKNAGATFGTFYGFYAQSPQTASPTTYYPFYSQSGNPVFASPSVPSAYNSAGTAGEIAWDSSWLYVHNGTRWGRVALDFTTTW